MNVAIKGINDHFSELARHKLAEQQVAADARPAEATIQQHLANIREDDHGPALLMNAEFDTAREAERVRLQNLAAQHVADERPMLNPAAAWPAKVVDAQGDLVALADEVDDDTDLTNDEITAMGSEAGYNPPNWVERLDAYVKWARSERQEVAA